MPGSLAAVANGPPIMASFIPFLISTSSLLLVWLSPILTFPTWFSFGLLVQHSFYLFHLISQ
jgi:hypothetical protein